jgi:hypothetical protein
MRVTSSMLAVAILGLGLVSVLKGEDKADAPKPDAEGFYSLFNGKNLDGWKAAEHPETFKVEDGVLVVNGQRAHLFYVGPVNNHEFKNFHLRAELMTFPKANSGIYFHTQYQDTNWPSKGFECQVNQTHGDPKKTGGLYGIKDVMNQSPVKDNEWYAYDIIVKDKTVTLKINDKVTTEWTQPDDFKAPQNMAGRKLSSGTIAIQGHDPGSKVLYRKIMIKPLD